MEQESTATLYITYSIGVCISSINTVFLKGYNHRSTPVHRSHHSCEEVSPLEQTGLFTLVER